MICFHCSSGQTDTHLSCVNYSSVHLDNTPLKVTDELLAKKYFVRKEPPQLDVYMFHRSTDTVCTQIVHSLTAALKLTLVPI